jgi:dipeptidase
MCYQIAVGKKATQDGSVMVARSCDTPDGAVTLQICSMPMNNYEKNETMKFPWGTEVKQVETTYKRISITRFVDKIPIDMVGGGINDFQVSVGSSSGGILNERAKKVLPRHDTELGDYRMTLVLERSKTAREAVKNMAELTEKYGARTDIYILADPNEAWVWEEYHDKLWVAVKVPDDCYLVEANTFRIGEVDLDDSENYMGSKNLISLAEELGLYNPKIDGPFNCAKIYGAQRGKMRFGIPLPYYDTRRIWRGISLLTPSLDLDPEAENFPLFVQPDKKLTPKDLIKVLRDHYQGTIYDLYGKNSYQYNYSDRHINKERKYQYSPSWNIERPIGIARSATNWVAQLRDWLPNSIGGLLWGGLGAAWANGHTPWYVGITKTPKAYNKGTNDSKGKGKYNEESAYWAFETVTNLVNLFYRNNIDLVLPKWEEWEGILFEMQPSVEQAALELYEKDPKLAMDYLTSYSNAKGSEALQIAQDMIPKLLTRIASKNTGL